MTGRSEHLPVTMCWHCDRPLDAATGINTEDYPEPEAMSVCMYCGAVAIFADDLRLRPLSKEELDELSEDKEFMGIYMHFSWQRQYVMITSNLMRDRKDPDR